METTIQKSFIALASLALITLSSPFSRANPQTIAVSAAHAETNSVRAAAIPFDQIGAMAGKQYSGDGLTVTSTPNGATLHCVFQRLDGRVTTNGLWLTSTKDGADGEPFRVMARALGRDTAEPFPGSGKVEVDGQAVRFVRPGLIEEYSVGIDGLQQDFVIERRPNGKGSVRLELEVDGAKAEVMVGGAKLVLADGGRNMVYNRLKVLDARGKELTAKLEVPSPNRLVVILDDAAAQYPVRIDPTFSDANWISFGGMGGVNGTVYTAVVDNSGNLYIGGSFNIIANNIAEWNGSSWSQLGSGMNGFVHALAVSGGTLYAGGTFTSAGGVAATNIAQWNGSSWSALGTAGILWNGGFQGASVLSLAASANNLYVGGTFNSAGGISTYNIAEWNGSSWSPLGPGLYTVTVSIFGGHPSISYGGKVAALAISGNTLYAAGLFTTNNSDNLGSNDGCAEWNGSSWTFLGSGGTGAALAVSGTNLFLGGSSTIGPNIAEWNGSAWSALGQGVNGSVNALAVSGGNLFVGGNFNNPGGITTSNIAEWNGSAWSGLEPGVNGAVSAIAASGNSIFIGGSFTTAGTVAANNIAQCQWTDSFTWQSLGRGIGYQINAVAVLGDNLFAAGWTNIFEWNGSAWSAGSGMNGPVSALAVLGTNLFAGGDFTSAGGASAAHIAEWNGNIWLPLGSGVNGTVSALAVLGNNLFAGGNFTSAGGVSAFGIAEWNGSSWWVLGPGMGGASPTVSALAVSGNTLYAGGYFTTAGGVSANYIAKWNGSNWSPLGSGMNNAVYALAVSGNTLYAGGHFATAGGVSANYIAQWNGSSWSALGTGMGGDVDALGVLGTNLIAGGQFTSAGGNPASYIAEWNGNSWSTLGTGMPEGVNSLYGPGVYCLAVSGNTLFVGGYFSATNGISENNIAEWNGSSWSALGPETWNGPVLTSLAIGNDLFVGGSFTVAGGVPANCIAKWNGSSWSPLGSGLAGGDSNGPYVSALTGSGANLDTHTPQIVLIVGGDFTSVTTNTAEWYQGFVESEYDFGSWFSYANVNGPVHAFALGGNTLYIGGSFTAVSGVTATNIAEASGSSWYALGTGLNGPVNALTISGTNVFAGGNFTTAGGVSANDIAQWNGSSWSALGTGLNGAVNTLAIMGNSLFVGGSFTTASGVPADDIAQWNGGSWSALGSGINGQVNCLAVSGNNLFAGGSFSAAGGVPANNIAEWNGDSWLALGSGISGGNAIVNMLATSGDSLFVGGNFNLAGKNISPFFAQAVIYTPTVSIQPNSINILTGSNTNITASAAGPSPLSYQWYFNGVPIPGATNYILPLQNLTTNQSGNYTVTVANAAGSTTSTPAILAVFNPAVITGQTTNLSTVYGFTNTLSVAATGTSIQYQWFFGSTPIAGATNSSLNLLNVSNTNAGTYYVVVSNPVSSVQSQSIPVSVFTALRTLPTGNWPGVNPPIGYWPNVPMTYTIEAGAPSGTIDYAVQEQITGGNGTSASVTKISDGGVFNAISYTINWGPFFDNSPRTLTYVLTPSSGTSNWLQFNGVISINGTNSTVVGNNEINLLPLDPADNGGNNSQPIDNYISINEMTAYASAWKNSTVWPVVPNPIPISYVTSAGVIWKQGEYYVYNPGLGAPPACWVNATPPQGTVQSVVASTQSSSVRSNIRVASPLGDSSSTAICSMPTIFTNNVPFNVTITVTPASSVGVYAVEDEIPFGWTATNFSTSGAFDSINNEVKYGPFFDNSVRTLTYQVTPAANTIGTVAFSGTASYDGLGIPISGVRQAESSITPPVFQQMTRSAGKLVLSLSVVPTIDYQLQYSTNLLTGNWVNVGGILTSTNSTMSVTNTISSNHQGFYRVQLAQ